jgi:hypothetical protein
MRSLAALAALAVFCVGCGIPEAVGDECGPYRRAFEMLSKRQRGMLERGVSPTAPILASTNTQLARAREDVMECSGESS